MNKMNQAVIGKFPVILLLLIGVCSYAADMGNLQIHGFSTAAFTQSSNNDNALEQIGHHANFDNDSKLGINLSSELGNQWSIAGQLIADYSSQFRPVADWAFVTWHPNGSSGIRFGKQKTAWWLYSGQIDVGLTYPWVRPPREMYYLGEPVRSYSGVSAYYNFLYANWELSTTVFYGASDFSMQRGVGVSSRTYHGTMKDFRGLEMTLTNDHVSFRGQYAAGDDSGLKVTTYAPSGPIYLLADTALNATTFKFISLGTKIEFSHFLMLSEYATRRFEGKTLHRADAAYAMAGYKIQNLMPHVTYSWIGNIDFDPNPAFKMPNGSQSSVIAGLNYRATDSVVIKLEYQRTQSKNGKGLFENAPAVLAEGVKAHLINASVDLVF